VLGNFFRSCQSSGRSSSHVHQVVRFCRMRIFMPYRYLNNYPYLHYIYCTALWWCWIAYRFSHHPDRRHRMVSESFKCNSNSNISCSSFFRRQLAGPGPYSLAVISHKDTGRRDIPMRVREPRRHPLQRGHVTDHPASVAAIT